MIVGELEYSGLTNKLENLRHSLKTVFLDKFNHEYHLTGASTDTKIFDEEGTDLVEKHAEPEERLASVDLVTTGRGDFSFIIEDTLAQSSRIIRKTQNGAKPVYSFNSKKIVAFQ